MTLRSRRSAHRSPVPACVALILGAAACGSGEAADIDPTAASDPVVLGVYVGATPARYDAPAYFVIDQRGGDDEIVEMSVERVGRVSLMGADAEMDVTTGAATAGDDAGTGFPLALAAGARRVFAPGGDHVMLEGLADDLAPGETLQVTFEFARHEPVVAEAEIVQLADLLEVDMFWEDGDR